MRHIDPMSHLVCKTGLAGSDQRGPDAPYQLCSSKSTDVWLRPCLTMVRYATRIAATAMHLGCRNVSYRYASRNRLALLAVVPALCLTAGCATRPMTESGALTSYGHLGPVKKGRAVKSRVQVNKEDVLAARTVRILPTRFADAVGTDISEKNRSLVANAIDRSICRRLSTRFDVVDGADAADLNIQATITHLGTTNRFAAGASAVVGFIPSALSSIPLISPRVPVGLGSLTVEVEALDRGHQQDAAMIWAGGANAVQSTARVSEVGDAYELASDFGGKFSQILITGEKPSGKLKLPKLPKIGGSKKDSACNAYGKSPGILGMITDSVALPPNVADKGRTAEKVPAEISPGFAPDAADRWTPEP